MIHARKFDALFGNDGIPLFTNMSQYNEQKVYDTLGNGRRLLQTERGLATLSKLMGNRAALDQRPNRIG